MGCATRCIVCVGVERERLSSELMVLLSSLLRKHANIGKGYEEILTNMLAPSGSKDCLIELLCKGVVSNHVSNVM